MVIRRDECVGCPKEMGCLGKSCPNLNVPHYYCDKCGNEFDADELYDFDGEMYCADCILDNFEKWREEKWLGI